MAGASRYRAIAEGLALMRINHVLHCDVEQLYCSVEVRGDVLKSGRFLREIGNGF